MANAYERWSERTGSKAANNADIGVRVFDITGATSEADCYTATLVLTDLSNPTGKVPVFNEVDPRNERRRVNSRVVTSAGLNLMRLTVGYAIPPNGLHEGDGEGEDANPLALPARWSWSRSKTVETVDRDRLGNPIVNSNGEPFENGAQRTFTNRILEARRFESVYPAALAEVYEDTVNSETFNGPQGVGFGAGTVKCNIVTVVGEYSDNSPYVEVLYQFEIKADGWKTRQLDMGTKGRDSNGGMLPLYHTNGDKVTAPVLLDGGGVPIDDYSFSLGDHTGNIVPVSGDPPPGAEVEVAPGGIAAFLRYELYDPIDLNTLGL